MSMRASQGMTTLPLTLTVSEVPAKNSNQRSGSCERCMGGALGCAGQALANLLTSLKMWTSLSSKPSKTSLTSQSSLSEGSCFMVVACRLHSGHLVSNFALLYEIPIQLLQLPVFKIQGTYK